MKKVVLYKKKKTTIGRRFNKWKKYAAGAAALVAVLFGNLEIPVVASQVSAVATDDGSSVSSNIYHTHTGSTSSGGGCYGKAVYHTHTGSAGSGGACYQTKVYHSHTGSTSAGGGCYGKKVYHTHSGNAQVGGTCYSPVYHTHDDGCMTAGTCYMSYELSPVTETWQEYCYHHQETNHGSAEAVVTHSRCGLGRVETVVRYCIACGPYPVNHEYEAVSCGLTEKSIESYRLSCGKTTSTIDSYALNCGKSSSTVDSYKLSCTKTAQTIDSYQRDCGLEEGKVVARLVLSNETAGAQQVVKLSAKIEDLSGGKLNTSGGTFTWYDSSGNVLSGKNTVEVKKNGTYRVEFAPGNTEGKLTGLTSSITVKNVYIPTPTPTATPRPTATSTPTATPKPTATPTAKPTAAPTAKPTAAPTAKPTATPTAKPTAMPTAKPTAAPTAKPTATPTAKPTAAPTAKPTATPTAKPTAAPTAKPTAIPTAKPTATLKPQATPVATLSPAGTVSPSAPSNMGGSGNNSNQNHSGSNHTQTNQGANQGTNQTVSGPKSSPTPTVIPTATPTSKSPSLIQSVQNSGEKITQSIMENVQKSPTPSPSKTPAPTSSPEPVQEENLSENLPREESEVLGEERKEGQNDWKRKLGNFMQKPAVKVISITAGTFLSAGLLALLYFFLRRTMKVYNDDGRGEMVYLGRCVVIGGGEDFRITITEEMEEKACTNRYCIRPGLFMAGRSEDTEILVCKGKKKIAVYLSKEMIVVI